MREVVDIRDYIGHARELTAVQVRYLPIGTKVVRHSFTPRGYEHVAQEMTVVDACCKAALEYRDANGDRHVIGIKKETHRLCYTEVEE